TVALVVQRLRGLAAAPAAGDGGRPSPTATSSFHPEVDFLTAPQGPGEVGRLGGYRVLKVLGSGGMGVVLEAEDPTLERLVAIKVMRRRAGDTLATPRFLREAKSAAQLKHDNIVTVHHVGEEGGVPFLVMELLEGESLERRLRREGRLPVLEVLRVGREVA